MKGVLKRIPFSFPHSSCRLLLLVRLILEILYAEKNDQNLLEAAKRFLYKFRF